MKNNDKTKEQLLKETALLKAKIAELEKSEVERLSSEQAGNRQHIDNKF